MIINNEKIRILGKGITALALKDKFPNATLYDDNDFNELSKKQQVPFWAFLLFNMTLSL